jgi:hypothetical protein
VKPPVPSLKARWLFRQAEPFPRNMGDDWKYIPGSSGRRGILWLLTIGQKYMKIYFRFRS